MKKRKPERIAATSLSGVLKPSNSFLLIKHQVKLTF